MSDINSLPSVSSGQLSAMNKVAEEKYGIESNPEPQEKPSFLHQPVLEYPEASEPVQEQVEQIQDAQEESVNEDQIATTKKSVAENMRRLREKANMAERERDYLKQQLSQMQPNIQSSDVSDDVSDEDVSIDPDALVEGKHLSKMAKEIKALKQQLHQNESQSQQFLIENKLKSQFPDFDKVVSAENITLFNELYPDLARSIGQNPDLYGKGVSAYSMIKQFGIHRENTFSNERAIAAKNIAKPKPLTSIAPQQGDTPLSRANAFANGLTDDLKNNLLKEMAQSRKSM